MTASKLSRRDFIQCAAMVTAGAAVVPTTWSMSPAQSDFLVKNQDFLNRHQATLFNLPQRATVATVASHIIPTTEMPGAEEANVALFIELMVQHWFTQEERDNFLAALDRLVNSLSVPFPELEHGLQLAVLESMEDAAEDAAWFELGNTMRTWDSDAPFICQFKELTVLGFMLSEVGSTEFLSPNPMGSFDGSIPLTENDSAHAVQIPIRVLSKAVQ